MKRFIIFLVPLSMAWAEVSTVTVDGVKVDIYQPVKECQKNILMLPGWSYSRTGWHQKTDLLKFAESNGYCLAFPEMGKAIYASRYFEETKRKVFKIPPQAWFQKNFFPEFERKYAMFRNHQSNFIVGLSTGARGAVLVALSYQHKFDAIAALSGDYNQVKMPADKLMTKVYGPFSIFKERWMSYDNPYYRAYQWRLPLYLGHGKPDKVISVSQSVDYYKKLKELHPETDIRLHLADQGHNYEYWNSELGAIFDFFEEHKK